MSDAQVHMYLLLFSVYLFAVDMRSAFRWRGDYGGKKQLWFPANYVEEVPSSPTREMDEAVSSDSLTTFK